MKTYYCILETGRIPLVGFATYESAASYQAKNGIGGTIKPFDTRTLQYADVVDG